MKETFLLFLFYTHFHFKGRTLMGLVFVNLASVQITAFCMHVCVCVYVYMRTCVCMCPRAQARLNRLISMLKLV